MYPPTCCLTLDVEPDCGGIVQSVDTLRHLPEVVDLVRRLDVPLTAFVSGMIFDRAPDSLAPLDQLQQLELGVHAYSHRDVPDRSEEIRRGVAAYEGYCGRPPLGYRAPFGRIDDADLRLLTEVGLAYDSSIFPSYRPGIYQNLFAPNVPHRHGDTGLPELPITAMRPLPVPLGLGYLRVLGLRGTRAALRIARLPETVVIGFHVHDLFEMAHLQLMEAHYRAFFRLNLHRAEELLSFVIETLRTRGYRFALAHEVVSRCDPAEAA